MNAIVFDRVSKDYSGRPALEDVSFGVPEGKVFGCIGPNGSGKTTAVRLILGVLRPASGRVTVFGRTAHRLGISDRRRIGFLLEQPGTSGNLSPAANLAFYGGLYGVRSDWPRLGLLLSQLGLPTGTRTASRKISRGNRQKLAVACAILPDPDLLILDEPTLGLDPVFRRRMGSILDGFRKRGRTVLICSHDLGVIGEVCDGVVVLSEGRAAGVIPDLAAHLSGTGATLEEAFFELMGGDI
jgi:ABC-2 type transport system ATP-binding protein